MMLNKKNLKKGVSLITVLMFMLVATIAATATYKWLTSENVSSASRMQTARAQQAAMAGLVTAKSWMAFHGNETGAIIAQFIKNNKKPIHLNSVIKAADTSMVRDSMKYDVWLIGANTSKQPYTLKLASKGFDGNSGAYTEIGIFDVAGLYRINVPQAEEDVQLSSYKQALFGQSEGITGSDYLQSGIINGNFTGSNVPVIDDDMLITGDFSVQGGTGLGNNLYVKGSYSNRGSMYIGTNGVNNTTCKPGSDTTIVYIGGNMESCDGGVFHVCGDMYVGGNISYKCKIKVTGNMTIGGTLSRNNEAHGFDVGKYLIFEKSGKIDQGSNAGPGEFKVGKGVLLSNGKMSGNLNGYTMNLEDLWKYSSSNVSFNNIGTNRYEVKPSEGGGVLFNANVSSQNVIQNLNDLSENNSQTSAKLNKAGYWANRNRMKKMGNKIDPSTNKVPDPIILQDENVWKNKTMNASCGLGDRFKMDDAAVDKLNNCYASLSGKEDKLYNGFLVVKWVNSELQSVNKALNGKFVFYVDGSPSQTRLPRTTPGSVVMLYLLQGMNSTFQGDSGPSNYPMNYFIYSKGDIREIQSLDIHGGVMMANNSTLKKYQNNNKLQYDDAVVSALMLAGFIKSNPEFEKRAGGSGAGGGQQHQQHQGEDVLDSVYIAVAPQLRISLRTEYKNKEFDPDTVRNGDTVKPSILVLPRILYLPKDPRGKITDYFDVINLNGAHEEKNVNKVSCDPNEIPLNGKLYVNNTQLSEGVYTCKYNGQSYGEIPFYIVVNGNDNAMAKVRFENASYEIHEGQNVQIKIIVENSGGNPMSVDVYQDDTPYGWSVSGNASSSYVDGHAKLYKVPLTGSGTFSVGAFNVSAGMGASISSGVNLHLQQPCVGCKIGSPDHASVFIMGTFTVNRKDIETYCSKSPLPAFCSSDEYLNYKNAPSCDGLLNSNGKNTRWVIANGNNCKVNSENNSWECNTLINGDVHLDEVKGVNSALCRVIIPPAGDGNAIYNVSKIGEHDTLYASIKRIAYDLNVMIDGATSTGSKVHVYYSRDGKDSVELGYCTKEKCYDTERNMEVSTFKTYAGDTLFLTARGGSGDKFKFWEKDGGETVNDDKLRIVVAENNNIIANFNKEDAHCFYEDFAPDSTGKAFGLPCNVNDHHRCIDVCSSTPAVGASCSYDQSKYWGYGTKDENPNWVMVYDNSCNGACAKGGGPVMPFVDGNYIYTKTSDQYADNVNGPQAVILSSKENGANGILTSAFMTDVVSTLGVGSVNSGFIFRSNRNATEYYTVSVYGKSNKSKASNVYVGLCYVTAQAANKSQCVEKFLHVGNWGLSESEGFTDLTKINMILNVKNDSASVELKMGSKSVGNVSKTIGFNLSSSFGANLVHNDREHSHVGFKLANPNFRMFDISWISYDFGGKECWDYPRLMCSFKSNYAGGIVPRKTFVKPWVALSSFVSSKNYLVAGGYTDCKIGYYYNGCDNDANYVSSPNSYMCGFGAIKGYGPFWEKGGKMSSDSYIFTEDGLHGYDYSMGALSGTVKNASVELECPNGSGMPSTLGVTQSCGEFTVGNIQLCEENVDFVISREDCSSGSMAETCAFGLAANANVRDARIIMNIENEDHADLKIRLYNDATLTLMSGAYTTNLSGNVSFDVSEVLASGFDPENIMGVLIEVPPYKHVKVHSISSSCANALSAGACSVTYDGYDWIMKTNVRNADRCVIDLPTDSHADTSSLKGSCSKTLQFPEPNLNSGENEKEFVFKLTAIREWNGNSESAETTCSYKIAPVKISCSVENQSVNQGAGVPTLKYKFENCPAEGCSYSITLDGTTVTGGPVYDGEYTQSFDLNTLGAKMTAGQKVFVINAQGKENRTCSFNVVEYNEWATASNCKYDPVSKIFTADVAFEGAEWYGTLDIVDNLGNVHNIKNYTNQKIKLVSETISATINGSNNKLRFTPNGASANSVACDVPITAPPISLTCPTNVIEVAKPGASFTAYVTATGCSDGKCSLKVNQGDVSPKTGFKGGNVTITASIGEGNKTFKLTLSHDDTPDATCDIYANYKPESKLSVDCGSNMNKSEIPEKSQVKVTPHAVEGCNSNQCSYTVLRGGTVDVGHGSSYNGGEISFTDNGGTGTQNYTLRINDNLGGSKDCSFNVAYKAAGCTPKNYSVPSWNNLSIEEYFSSGCYDLNMDKSCSGVQVTASGSGTIKLNGQSLGCNYWYGTVNSQSSLKLEISAGCSVSKLYLDNCSSGSGSGGGSCNDCISTNFVSYQAGKSYTIKTGSLNESTFHCSASSVSWDRTIGTINGCTIVIPAWNDKSNGRGCSLQSNGQYTFVVNGGAPGDLKCGLSW